MKNLIVLSLLVLLRFNICAIDRQIAVAIGVTPATTATSNTINALGISGDTKVKFYDNVVDYKMKYFDTTEPTLVYANEDENAASVLGEAVYLYSFNRVDTVSSFSDLGPFEDPTAGSVADAHLFVRYHPIQYRRDNKINYPYIAFNVTPDCTDTTGKPPVLTMRVKFFCSDEEAKAEYDNIMLAFTTDSDPNLAYVSMSGGCVSSAATSDFSSALTAAVEICDLLTGEGGICA